MDSQDGVLQSFQDIVRPPRSSATYKVALLVVALAMVLLPVIYVALMGLVGYGVYYHAVNDSASRA